MNSEKFAEFEDDFSNKASAEIKKQLKKDKADTKCYLLLSFFVPCILVGICWIFMGVHPFGDRQILVTDFWHQYFPFANILHGKLRSFSSLLYTWQSGLGSNFIAMMAYYAASPLNLLTILIPDAFLRDGITFILLLKIGFAGLFTALFLKYTFNLNDISICFFAVMYALCSYILGYSWNIIWIDTVALLPLVMLGTVKIVRDKKCAVYIAALGLSLISNYYIGLFICIFTVIAFFCICIFECRGFKDFILSGFRMLGSTVVGIGLGAAILIPAYFALQLTNSADNSFPTDISFYENWFDVLANMTAFRKPTVKEGLPNLYCGIICVVLMGIFLRSGKIRIREKVSAIIVLAFLIISCNMNYLNFIWHGFHVTNMLPYRFSFLFSFVMIVVAYRAFELTASGKIKHLDIIAMTVVTIIFFAITWLSEKDDSATRAMWFSLMISIFYIVVMFLYERKIFRKKIMFGMVAIGLIAEMFAHTFISLNEVGTSDYISYPSRNEDVSKLMEDIEENDKDLFSRTEMNTWYTLNDPALYSYNGVSQFSSMANKNITTFLRTMGLPGSEAGNRYYYALSSPVSNMFTGVKYIISRENSVLDDTALEIISSEGSAKAYENKYSLPIGFMTNDDILSYDGMMHTNPFEAQNSLFSKATGISEALFTPIDVTHTAHIGMSADNGVYRRGYGVYTFNADESSDSHTFKFNFVPNQDSILYAYFAADGVTKVEILHNDSSIGSYNVTKQQGFIAPIGKCGAGVKATVSADISDENVKNGSLRIYVYSLNKAVLEMGYEKLKISCVKLDEFSDTHISGSVNALKDGICYFSIPQDNGWSAYIDGEKTDTKTVGNAMLAVPVKSGQHKIELRYSPEGFKAGLVISVLSVILWLAVLLAEIYMYKIRTKEKKI